MIANLAAHGLTPMDLSASLLQDAKEAQAKLAERNKDGSATLTSAGSGTVLADESDVRDIRYTILSHLFLMSIADGNYDSRARTVLRIVSTNLDIEYEDLVSMENYVANELRVNEHSTDVMILPHPRFNMIIMWWRKGIKSRVRADGYMLVWLP